MKKGRPGTRLEVLARPTDADRLEDLLLERTTTIGVRRTDVLRRSLPREVRSVSVDGQPVRLKVVRTPSGGTRAKPEMDDVLAAARALGRDPAIVVRAALTLLEETR
jgi:pyridinium-3,5-bisthiocarboxylic acid mononucleotide nickel chelatase